MELGDSTKSRGVLLKYSFQSKTFVNLKGEIAERLVRCYINDVLIPALHKTGWEKVVFTPFTWFGDETEINENRPPYARIFWRHEEKFFTRINVFPTQDFLSKFKCLTKLLKNLPDGFLVKMKRTGNFKPLGEALEELKIDRSWSEEDYEFNPDEHNEKESLPIVDGEIEVVEVKSGRSNLPPHQKRSYGNFLEKGYVLRFFHVNIISFKRNEFEIEQKLIKSSDELKSYPIKPR